MRSNEPTRQSNVDYFSHSAPFEIFYTTLYETIDLHWHEFYELMFVLSGEGVNLQNGTHYPLKKGSLFLLTPADFHELIVIEGKQLEVFNVIFSEEMIPEQLINVLYKDDMIHAQVFHGEQFELIQSDYQRLANEFRNKTYGFRLALTGTLVNLLLLLARSQLSNRKSEDVKQNAFAFGSIQKALNFVHHHFREALTLEQIANQTGFSPNYFSKCFHKTTGIAFQQYLQMLRLQFAKSLLRASDLPVTDICYASGFKTLSHFERCFKQHFHETPREYRGQSAGKKRGEVR